METIKLIGTSHDGKLTVAVPAEFNDKELEIMIISSKDKKVEDEEKKREYEERKEKFMSLAGSADDPGFR